MRTSQPIVGKIEHQVDERTASERWSCRPNGPCATDKAKSSAPLASPKTSPPLKQAEAKLEQAHKELVEASRLAGMAEVATSILHNVGNVLNSVNVSATLVAGKDPQFQGRPT